MSELFNDLNFVKVYLDDLLIHSREEKEHAAHVYQILSRLRENIISLNFEKSNFLPSK